MLDLNSDIDSLSNFKRNTPEFLRQLKETGHPVVLTINGNHTGYILRLEKR